MVRGNGSNGDGLILSSFLSRRTGEELDERHAGVPIGTERLASIGCLGPFLPHHVFLVHLENRKEEAFIQVIPPRKPAVA